MRVWLILACLLLAGCSGPSEDASPTTTTTRPPTTTSTPPPTTTEVLLLSDFAFTGCTMGQWTSDTDTARVQAWLPENYTAASQNGASTFQLTMAECSNLTTPTVTIGAFWIGWFTVPLAEVPGHTLESPHYVLRVLSSPGGPEAVWRQAGFDVATANASRASDVALPPAEVMRWTFGNTSADGQLVQQATRTSTHTWVAAHPVGGTLAWDVAMEASGSGGIGSFRFPASDPWSNAQDATGAARGEAFQGSGEFTEMRLVWLPPQ